jgi:uncharacterized protein (TIGR02001 family)
MLSVAPLTTHAQTPAPESAASAPAAAEAKPDWTITGNAGLFSEYRFRGISQTNKKPAFQGGFDISHISGFYVGNWNSNVDSALYNGANLEMDFYGGYKLPVGDFTFDFGALYYYYPGSGAERSRSTTPSSTSAPAGARSASSIRTRSATSSASTTRRTPGISKPTGRMTSATASA